LKNAERKITADLKKNLKEEKPLMKSIRETKWFEKFYWFISSEGYLIIGYTTHAFCSLKLMLALVMHYKRNF